MEGYLALVLFAVVGAVKARNSASGIFEDNRRWFVSNLSVRPAMSASIEYDIWYPYLEHYEDYPPIITFYYTGQNTLDLRYRCKADTKNYGQLYNKDLAILLNEDDKMEYYCSSVPGMHTYWNSRGRIEIQDFEPKTYFFSLGFECSIRRSLNCFQYNVTIYDESNTTRCVDLNMTRKYSDMSQQSLTDHCEVSYQYAAIPNQFGDTDLDGAMSRMNKFLRVYHSNVPSERFLKNLKSFLCETVLPKCLPEENKIILPCREDCKFYLEDYLKEVMNCDYLLPCEGRNSVSGIITDNTTWFHSNLSVRPEMAASIQYHIQFQWPNSTLMYEILENPPIITFYYEGQSSPNLQHKCNSHKYGQVFNKDLAVPLFDIDTEKIGCNDKNGQRSPNLRHKCTQLFNYDLAGSLFGRYRENLWCNDKNGGIRDCHGRIDIQDFEPKSYSFSLGFKCNERKGNLKGLKYDVTIYGESNKTSCLAVNMTELHRNHLCDHSYQDVAFPNPFGHTDPATTISALKNFLKDLNNQVGNLPKNEAKFWNKCLEKLKPFLCNIYLPQCLSEKNKILLPCRGICMSISQDCPLDHFGMDVNCNYLPPCPHTWAFVLGMALSTFVLLVVITLCIMKRQYTNKLRANTKKTDEPRLPRNRDFDAFVLYHFDSDDIYVLDTILPELEENRNFKLCIHSRDFTPGCDIKDNIEETIKGSNSAIIIMSQGFVDSMWCKEEFTHCYIENMNDPAFNLFVIMMQPANTLVNISSYMKTFFETKTYLDVNDPQLFTKLATLLDEARKPVKDDVDNHNNDNNDNIASDDETQEIEDTNI